MVYKPTTLLVFDGMIIACNVAFVVDVVTDLDGLNVTATISFNFGALILLVMGAVLLVDRIIMVGAGFLEIFDDLVGIVDFTVVLILANELVLFAGTFGGIKVTVFADVGMSLVVFLGTYLTMVASVVFGKGIIVGLAKVEVVFGVDIAFGLTVDGINLEFEVRTGIAVRAVA